jgi:multidrug efflux system membrane fusion protein
VSNILAVFRSVPGGLNSALAGIDQAKANIEIAKINLGYTKVTAPFTGRIGRHLVDVGNLVGTPSPTKLATIEQIQPIYVYFNVDEQTVLRIRTMMRERGLGPADAKKVPVAVGLQTEEGYPHKGKLDFVDTGIDPSTGTLQVRALLPNDDRSILPGVFVRVQVPVGHDTHAVLVSNHVLGVDQAGSYVLVVDADDLVQQRTVETGALVGAQRVITKGLEPTDWVVVEGLQRATPGTKVKVTRKDVSGETVRPATPAPAVPPGPDAHAAQQG